MRFRLVCLILLVMLSFSTTGFVCATRVEKMEADIEALQLQFAEIQKRVNNDQTQLTEMILRADRKLEELGSTQDQTHDRVAQQNVQLALELEKERAEMAAMRGRMDVQQKTITELQASLQTVLGSITSTSDGKSLILPSDQGALLEFIEAKKAAQDTAAQKAAISEYLRRYPNDEKAETLLPEYIAILHAEGADAEVIPNCTKYLQMYPNGKALNDVMYYMGDSGFKIGNCDLAKKAFMKLEAAKYKNASERLKEIKATCK